METSQIPVLISRWLHIGAVIVVIGGAAYIRLALIGAAAEVLDDDAHTRLREAVRTRWAKVVHGGIALLLLTGIANFVLLATPSKVEPMPYHAIFTVKLVGALVVFFLGTALVGKSPALAHIRANSAKWIGLLLAMAAGIVLLSGILMQVRTSNAKTPVTPTVASTE